MIYLTTGGNGAGKTLLTLFDVRQQQLKENRPVYFHGFTPEQILLDWGWKEFDPRKWQDLPDGSICIIDEAQNEFPQKFDGPLPAYVNAVAQDRRKRGFDFWMLTPHPSMIHPNIRKLIESPSWHRHVKRSGGADMAAVIRFNHADIQCEKPGSGARGEVTMRSYPKEVYKWYKSSALHTGKRHIPRKVWVFVGALALIPVCGWFAWDSLASMGERHKAPAAVSGAALPGVVPSAVPGQDLPGYLASFEPRVPDFPHTAARYDEVTKPVTAPYPAACVQSRSGCRCYSQQATRLFVSESVCAHIVEFGYFVDWDTAPGGSRADRREEAAAIDGPAALAAPRPAAPAPSADGQAIAALRSRSPL